MIPEDQINKAIDWVSNNIEEATKSCIDTFPQIFRYLYSGRFDLLTNEENELLLFIFLVVTQTVDEEQIEDFKFEDFSKFEEQNWDFFENQKSMSWEEKLNHTFEDYYQEDLLALVEDLLSDDDDQTILSQIGKEFIFVTAKSFIDCF